MISKQFIIGGIAGAIAITAVGATAGYRYMDSDNYADVLHVKSVPREECRDHTVTVQHPTGDPNQVTGTVAGAIIGGLVGSQIGDGDGKKVATVGGAVAGGYTGNKVQEGMQKRNVDQVNTRVCDSSKDTFVYDVTYSLDGTERTVRMNKDPGRRIRIENNLPVTE